MGDRPRAFAWIAGIAGPVPQILFDDPRVGCAGVKVLAELTLDPGDRRSLSHLAAAYPAPVLND